MATQDIHYVKPSDAEYQDILLAVQTGNTISDSNRLTMRDDDFSMTSPEAMEEFFKGHAGSRIKHRKNCRAMQCGNRTRKNSPAGVQCPKRKNCQ